MEKLFVMLVERIGKRKQKEIMEVTNICNVKEKTKMSLVIKLMSENSVIVSINIAIAKRKYLPLK